MELSTFVEHIARFFILMLGITFAVVLGRFRPEWRSRKTLICWVWTMVVADIIIIGGPFAQSYTAQLFIGGALILNVINFIGDRIETIKFKDFTANLSHEETGKQATVAPVADEPNKPIQYVTEDPHAWPDGDMVTEPMEEQSQETIPFKAPKRGK